MKHVLAKSIALALLLLTLTNQLQCAMPRPLTTTNYAEALLGGARGILASSSYRHKNMNSPTAKAIHVATDVTRLVHEILTIVNHPKETNYSTVAWAAFDISNLYLDLVAKDKQAIENFDNEDEILGDEINLSQEQKQTISSLAQALQKYLLPLVESGTSVYNALDIKRTPQDRLMRRRMQALCSLSRALSIYLNHQSSKLAIALLVGSISEVALSLHAKPAQPRRPQPQPRNRQPGQQPAPNDDNFNWNLWGRIVNDDNDQDDDFNWDEWQDNDEPNQNPAPPAQTPGEDDFDPDYWQDPERDREEERNRQRLAEEARIEAERQAQLNARGAHAPEVRVENGHFFIFRNGVRGLELVDDPIMLDPFERGNRVRIFACDHGILEENVADLQGRQETHCLTCNQPRVLDRELVVNLP